MAKGFVDVLSNAGMPGLLKIGFSTKVPTERAAELNTAGVPSPFEVEYYCLVNEPAGLESKVHRMLATSRQVIGNFSAYRFLQQFKPSKRTRLCENIPGARFRPIAQGLQGSAVQNVVRVT
jgi:hypothetical protein